jgi:hypothetical protein
VSLRTGYRWIWLGDGPGTHYVPAAVDVVYSPLRRLDVGASAMLYGALGSGAAGWASWQQFTLWIAGRI